MTILNVFVCADSAIVAVDSLRFQVLPDGSYGQPLGHQSKLVVFERAMAVLACRGMGGLGLYLRAFLGDGDMASSLDAIDDAMPKAFAAAEGRLQSHFSERGVSYTDPQAVRLAGYSGRAGRVVCIAFEQSAPGQGLSREVIEQDTELAPWDDLQGELPACDSVPSMRETAAAQIDFQRQMHGERSCVGGDIVLAKVQRDTVHLYRFAAPGPQACGFPN